jgi:hypothetical protein
MLTILLNLWKEYDFNILKHRLAITRPSIVEQLAGLVAAAC